MSALLFDIGNTRAKWAWLADDAAQPGQSKALAHAADGWLDELGRALDADRESAIAPSRIVIAAVAADALIATLRERLTARWPATRIDVPPTPAAAAGIRNGYREPGRLGIDRFLAMIGTRAHFPHQPFITIGVGSALALDLVDADGQHRGGLIAPTAPRMRDAVLGHTARVHWRDAPAVAPLGLSTEDALWSGAWQALAGLTERAVVHAAGLLGVAPRLVLHGGDGATLADLLRDSGHAVALVPDLVLQGLARLLRAT